MCYICGESAFVRCNCVVAQPLCDQCAPNSVCLEKIDSSCVIYHLENQSASKLIYLNMPNGSSAEAIFEKIDGFIGSSFNFPLTVIDTPSVNLTASGLLNYTIQADVKISLDANNAISIHSDGIYSSFTPDYKVKVDADAPPRYLADAMVGGTDGCISITVNDTAHLATILPSINITCLLQRICDDSEATANLSECLITSICANNGNSLALATCLLTSVCENSTELTSFATCLLTTGLFNTGGGITAVTADNGLTATTISNVQLGGTLLHDTLINHGGAYQLSFINVPNISIGTGTTQTNSSLYVEDITSTKTTVATIRKSGGLINSTNSVAVEAFSTLTGTTFTGSGIIVHNDGIDGQLNVGYSGAVTLQSDHQSSYSGIYGSIIKSGGGTITGNIITAGYFGAFAADGGNVSSIAAIRLAGPEQAATFGGSYSGTITNYYELYFNDIAASALNGNVTNKYNIFQEGATGLNSFSTAVVVTSDKRVKENVVNYEKGLSEIEKVQIVEYNIIGDSVKRIGVIAQDLEAVIPEAVQTQDRGVIKDFKVVDYNVLFSTLVNAIKELSARVKELEAK